MRGLLSALLEPCLEEADDERWYLREQTAAHVVHRYGKVMQTAATE